MDVTRVQRDRKPRVDGDILREGGPNRNRRSRNEERKICSTSRTARAAPCSSRVLQSLVVAWLDLKNTTHIHTTSHLKCQVPSAGRASRGARDASKLSSYPLLPRAFASTPLPPPPAIGATPLASASALRARSFSSASRRARRSSAARRSCSAFRRRSSSALRRSSCCAASCLFLSSAFLFSSACGPSQGIHRGSRSNTGRGHEQGSGWRQARLAPNACSSQRRCIPVNPRRRLPE